jgi:hypothetical protein
MTVNVNNVSMEVSTALYMVTTEQLASNSSVSRTATTGVAKNGTTMILALAPAAAGGAAARHNIAMLGVG